MWYLCSSTWEKNLKQRPFFRTLALCATLKWTTDLFANSKIKSEENHSLWFHMENIFTLFTTTRRGRRRIHLWKNKYTYISTAIFVCKFRVTRLSTYLVEWEIFRTRVYWCLCVYVFGCCKNTLLVHRNKNPPKRLAGTCCFIQYFYVKL